MDFAAKLRAARGLLGWSQSELAQRTGVKQQTIADIELRRRDPRMATYISLTTELERAGIEFLPAGVQMREMPVRFLRGPEWPGNIIADILTSCPPGAEVWAENLDEFYAADLRAAGLNVRTMTIPGAGEGADQSPVIVYADKVAISMPIGEAIILTNAITADAFRLRLKAIWATLRPRLPQ